MPVNPHDRPIEALRQDVIDQLIMNYSHGVLSQVAFERRLDQAMETREHSELLSVTEDLDLDVDKKYAETRREQLGLQYEPGQDDDTEFMVQIFGGNDRSGNWKVPKEIRVFSVFGGSTIDLSEAIFTHSVTRIRVFNLFAGEDILVPEGINVQTRTFCIFAGVDNSSSGLADPGAPTIIIEGLAIFSGIDIEVKRTLKERFMIFADRMRDAWAR